MIKSVNLFRKISFAAHGIIKSYWKPAYSSVVPSGRLLFKHRKYIWVFGAATYHFKAPKVPSIIMLYKMKSEPFYWKKNYITPLQSPKPELSYGNSYTLLSVLHSINQTYFRKQQAIIYNIFKTCRWKIKFFSNSYFICNSELCITLLFSCFTMLFFMLKILIFPIIA